jgi:hypothetical protein
MNEKININLISIIFIASFVLGVGAGLGLSFIVSPANQFDNRRIEEYKSRERDLLARIGEYERREKERTAREARRIEAEGRRIEQTEKRLRAIWELDRRTGDLYEDLAREAGVLSDHFYYSKREYLDSVNSGDSGKIDN